MSAGEQGDREEALPTHFQTTHWTAVLQAQDNSDPQARAALEGLCVTYWRPLYSYVRRVGSSREEAEDLTQEFFRAFLERNALASVDPGAGRFRSFLLACLKHFLANERKRAHAQRRGGGIKPVPLNTSDTESRLQLDPEDPRSPEETYDRQWALTLIEGSLADLGAEYAARRQAELFAQLKGFLPGGGPSLSRTELALLRGTTVGAIDVAVHRLRQQFGNLLRARVALTVSARDEIDDEIRHLITLLTS